MGKAIIRLLVVKDRLFSRQIQMILMAIVGIYLLINQIIMVDRIIILVLPVMILRMATVGLVWRINYDYNFHRMPTGKSHDMVQLFRLHKQNMTGLSLPMVDKYYK